MKLTANHTDRAARANPDEVGKSTNVERSDKLTRPKRVTPSLIVKLAAHLTERDRQIARDCYEHHVLTTDQIARLHFAGRRTATARLSRLYELRVLDRFRPRPQPGEGSHPHHWLLDEAGALVVADAKGIDPSELHYTHEHGLRIAASRNLTHHVEANEFFTRLAVDANAAGGALSEWYGVRTLAHMLTGAVIPDGYGVLSLPGAEPLHVLLELDRATETTRILTEKARRYAEILPRTGLRDCRPVVIVAVPSARRADGARAALAATRAPVAVAIWNRETLRSVLATVTHCARTVHTVSLTAMGNSL
jgi:hypothetical protein